MLLTNSKIMKHIYLIALLSFICFISCSDDDDKISSSNIVGKWQLVSSTDKDTEPCLFKGYVEFLSNGKYEDKTGCNNANGDGRWELKGDGLTITANILPIPITGTVKSLTDEEFIFELEGIGFDDNYEVITVKYQETYKRVE